MRVRKAKPRLSGVREAGTGVPVSARGSVLLCALILTSPVRARFCHSPDIRSRAALSNVRAQEWIALFWHEAVLEK